jgi:hypothetical protein
MVALDERTHALVVEEIQRLVAAIELGQADDVRDCIDNPAPQLRQITMNAFVLMLLEQRQAKRMRRRKSALARRRAKARPSALAVARAGEQSR